MQRGFLTAVWNDVCIGVVNYLIGALPFWTSFGDLSPSVWGSLQLIPKWQIILVRNSGPELLILPLEASPACEETSGADAQAGRPGLQGHGEKNNDGCAQNRSFSPFDLSKFPPDSLCVVRATQKLITFDFHLTSTCCPWQLRLGAVHRNVETDRKEVVESSGQMGEDSLGH